MTDRPRLNFIEKPTTRLFSRQARSLRRSPGSARSMSAMPSDRECVSHPAPGPEEWAEQIISAWRATLEAIFETGRLLIRAKGSVPHGAFLPMIASELPFSHDTASKLMRIAADGRLTNIAHARYLPPHWATLFELTKLTDAEFQAGIANGEIHPELQRKELSAVNRTNGTANDEWFTPADIIKRVRAVLGEIDLDPASHAIAQRTVRAGTHFTKATNGLTKEWHGRVWLNPPYTYPVIGQFVEKLIEEIDAGRVSEAVMLTHAYTDTAWFQRAAKAATAVCFTRGRVRFVSPDGEIASPTQGQAFFYFGADPTAFRSAFAELGFIVETV